MKTEAEARQCWCPFARAVLVEDASEKLRILPGTTFNRLAHVDAAKEVPQDRECNCIASECMAWRWGRPWYKADADGKMVEQPLEGYCGLAGKE